MLCSSAVASNANSKLLRLDLVLGDVSIPSTERMELALRICQEYDSGTAGSVERLRASRQADKRPLYMGGRAG